MSFVQREIERVGAALSVPQSTTRYLELYAAQQALMWALEPIGFKPPYDMIVGSNIPADTEDCQAVNGHSPSLDILDRRAS